MSIDIDASAIFRTLQHFVSANNVHPILVNFTAALIPVSVVSDILARVFGKPSLRDTGWWTLCFAAIVTPFTASAGWLLWTHDYDGVIGMTIHKWLGTSLALLVVGLVLWRWTFFKRTSNPSVIYLLLASVVVGAVFYQGHLGGKQSFGCNSIAPQKTLITNAAAKLLHGSAEISGFADQSESLGVIRSVCWT